MARLFASIWCLSLLLCACGGEETRNPPRLVLLVSLDTLRADRLGAVAGGHEVSPNLDALAREAWRFETVGAQAAQTLVSHKSLFAGRYPFGLLSAGTGLEPAAYPRGKEARDALIQGLTGQGAELLDHLRADGWKTAAFTDGGWMRRELGFGEGFDLFDESGGGLEALVPRVSRWLTAEPPVRTFLFLHAYDVHCPYPTREPFDSRFCTEHETHVSLEGRCAKRDLEREELGPRDFAGIRAHYDASIASADAYLGELIDNLRARNLWEETLLVVTSDHGELLGEGGRLGHGGLEPSELLVPLLVRFPTAWEVAPRVVSSPIELVDLMPSLLEACGVAVPPGLDGRSFLGLLDETYEERSFLVAQTVFRQRETGRSVLWKSAALEPERLLVITDGATGESQVTVLGGEPSKAEADHLADRLRALEEGLGGNGGAGAPGRISPELAEELRALGYGDSR